MCGRPAGSECQACANDSKRCYHDGNDAFDPRERAFAKVRNGIQAEIVAADRGDYDEGDDGFCHCGEPVRYGYDDNPQHHRGMCDHCDSVRCDAYPGECGR